MSRTGAVPTAGEIACMDAKRVGLPYHGGLCATRFAACLDHGFIRLVDHMGSDEDIEQAARVSYQSGTREVNDTRGLIRTLRRCHHTSPFEMAVLKFHVRLPIFIARQWWRHRTASINEMSARYSELGEVYWMPDIWRGQDSLNKQGSDGSVGYYPWDHDGLGIAEETAFHEYRRRLDAGVAREQARSCTPVSTYTEAFWKIDLHNLFHFLQLRMDGHAQQEFREYAEAIAEMVKERFPLSWEAFEDYQLNGMHLSAMEVTLLHSLLTGNAVQTKAMSKREVIEWEMKRDRIMREAA